MTALIKASGGRFIALGNAVGFVGEQPKRVSVHVWDSMEKIQAWRNSSEFKQLMPLGKKYAKFREYAVEGVPQ